MKQVSDLVFTSALSLREQLLIKLKEDPELFLLSTSRVDVFVITTIIADEVKVEADAYNKTLDDREFFQNYKSGVLEEHELFLRIDRDLSTLDIPYRIALTGWLLLPELPIRAAIRLYEYALGLDEGREETLMREMCLACVQRNYMTLEQVSANYKSSELVQYTL